MPRLPSRPLAATVAAALLGLLASTASAADPPFEHVVPKGLGKIAFPKDNLSDPRKIALGKQLYFDPRLSADKTVSCASCHDPAKGWSDARSFSAGVGGQLGGRNAPTIVNAAFSRFHFWDGRAATLEEQALGPIANPIEMNLPIAEAVERLNGIAGYKEQFREIFGADVTPESLAWVIAAYERTILSGDAPYDRYKAGDKGAMSPEAVRGMTLFFGKANCSACHSGPNFTDNAFHNIGIGMDKPEPDQGRFVVSKLEGDTGAFKTPTVREIARSAPYMHDGSQPTLEAVVEHYDKGGIANPQLDEEIFKLGLTPEQKSDLVTFLKEGLSSDAYPLHEAPKLPE